MKRGLRRAGLAVLLAIAILGFAAFISYGNFDLQMGTQSLVRRAAADRAASEAQIRREHHEFDLKSLERQLAVLRGDTETLIHSRFGEAPAWAREIRMAYFARTPCSAYLRWRAGDDLHDYFERKPKRQFVTVEDLKTTHPDIEKLRREAGMMAVPKLLKFIRTPQIARRCELDDATEISEAIIDVLAKLDLKPEDFGTTAEKIAADVKAAR